MYYSHRIAYIEYLLWNDMSLYHISLYYKKNIINASRADIIAFIETCHLSMLICQKICNYVKISDKYVKIV